MRQINCKNYVETISSVLIDDRENKRIDYAMEQYAPLNPLKCHLDIGDYIFVGNNGIKVVWEYKTGSDFLNSINSETNHLHNQVYEMTRKFDYTFVIVQSMDLIQEIDELYYSSGVSMSLPQIDGAIAEYCTESTVLFAQTQYQAFDLMMRVAGKIIKQKPLRYKYGKKSTNSALNYLGSIKGIDEIAEDICRVLNLRTHEDLQRLSKKDLMKVNGIGDKKATKIIGELQNGLQK